MNGNSFYIHPPDNNQFVGSMEPKGEKKSVNSSGYRYSWTQEKDLELIKYVSIAPSWKKLAENIFPEYKTVSVLRRHYWTLFKQKESQEILKKQFDEYPPPHWLKVDKTAHATFKKKRALNQKWELEMDLNLIQCVATFNSWVDIQKNVFPQFKSNELLKRYRLLLKQSASDKTLENQFMAYPPPRHLKFPADIIKSGIIQKYSFSQLGDSFASNLNLKKFWTLEKDLALIESMSEENSLDQIKLKLSFPGSVANLHGHYRALIKRKFQNSALAQQFDKYPPHRSKPSLCKYLKNALDAHIEKALEPAQDFTEEEKKDIEKIAQELSFDTGFPMEQAETDAQNYFTAEDLEMIDQLFGEDFNPNFDSLTP